MASLRDIIARHKEYDVCQEDLHISLSDESARRISLPTSSSSLHMDEVLHFNEEKEDAKRTRRKLERSQQITAVPLYDASTIEATKKNNTRIFTDSRPIGSSKDNTRFCMPYTPYAVQLEMMQLITTTLQSRGARAVPVVATEVPTGCGKTLALLSSVLQFQASVKRMTPSEAEKYFREGDYWRGKRNKPETQPLPPPLLPQLDDVPLAELMEHLPTTTTTTASTSARSRTARGAKRGGAAAEDGEDAWSPPAVFFKQFRVDRTKRLRAEVASVGSSELRRQFDSPPCTIFYATRTHAQLRQAVHELRKLKDAETALRVNVLGSRDHYCVHQQVIKAKKDRTLPVEGNNLGEVCDKLVSLGHCEAVHGFGELAASAMTRPMPGKKGLVWDLEDLVKEGVAQNACPYYAARDLVFFADVNFCTYLYLLDPLIRHECKMEAAIKNRSIVVFDEAHNVSSVCQEVLSVSSSSRVFTLFATEIGPLIRKPVVATGCEGGSSLGTAAALSYPREFALTHYTLCELFGFLGSLFQIVEDYLGSLLPPPLTGMSNGRVDTNNTSEDVPFEVGSSLSSAIRQGLTAHMRTHGLLGRSDDKGDAAVDCWLPMFRQAYGIVMSLGVTFNPFQISVYGLSMMKRWLLILRFLLQKPEAFAICARCLEGEDVEEVSILRHMAAAGVVVPGGCGRQQPLFTRTRFEIRCLDGGLAFHHLLRVTHRVVIASGTLSPFSQLARDLNLTASQMNTYDGLHVVKAQQYRFCAVSKLPLAGALKCTYGQLRHDGFMADLVQTIWTLVQAVPSGGILIFAPNYSVMQQIFNLLQNEVQRGTAASHAQPSPPLFIEPRRAAELPQLLDAFRSISSRRVCLLLAVYRGKVSEGIDFTDEMARLVVCVGVPLQPLRSWTVRAQRAYSGPDWYKADAVRAVNQALGRCLRHVADFGCVVLLDERYTHADHKMLLSRWCRDAVQTCTSVSDAASTLREFFAGARRNALPPPPPPHYAPPQHLKDVDTTESFFHEVGGHVGVSEAVPPPCASRAALLGSEHIPFARIQRSVPSGPPPPPPRAPPGTTRSSLVPSSSSKEATPLLPAHKHAWASTAMKLLCEGDGADTTATVLRGALEDLEEHFAQTPSE